MPPGGGRLGEAGLAEPEPGQVAIDQVVGVGHLTVPDQVERRAEVGD